DLSDDLVFSDCSGLISVSCDGASIAQENNIIFKAAKAMQGIVNNDRGVSINVKKNIPIGAGLGGGSSNAATTILALNKIWNMNLDEKEMVDIGRTMGADVPFFIKGTNAYASGIGDIFNPKDSISEKVIIIDPMIFNSSKEMFDEYDNWKKSSSDPLISEQNSFWNIFIDKNKSVREFYQKNIKKYEICLSGSGSSMFIRYTSDSEMKKILKIIPPKWRFFLAKPLQYSRLKSLDNFGV
ncbi:4-(cytidine 5'-diphospho)-2-C-methyl-D-erythritol kinase, partial [Gammaproteobacteria bacterium]|nr:4-(cytidine 5'-diphospho)-2-C-methyl-D-erythritol kinase [Gammaproteobacteria bacterium]